VLLDEYLDKGNKIRVRCIVDILEIGLFWPDLVAEA
jgi:hypothetical protein